MIEKNDTIESLVAGGLLGAGLGALLSKDKEEGAVIGAILGAAFAATLRANSEAQKTKVPLIMYENGALYRVQPDGEKVFVRALPQVPKPLSTHFVLE